MTDPDTPDWLPPLALGLFIVVGTWALAPWLSELVGARRTAGTEAGVSLADGGVE